MHQTAMRHCKEHVHATFTCHMGVDNNKDREHMAQFKCGDGCGCRNATISSLGLLAPRLSLLMTVEGTVLKTQEGCFAFLIFLA